jgi:hypothetical protein
MSVPEITIYCFNYNHTQTIGVLENRVIHYFWEIREYFTKKVKPELGYKLEMETCQENDRRNGIQHKRQNVVRGKKV